MSRTFLDGLIERTVVPSFTSIGPTLRRRMFDWQPLESYDLTGRTVVLTGGTSGIGEAAARLYARLGAQLTLVARNEQKTARAVDALKADSGNDRIDSVIADLGVLDDVRAACDTLLQRHPQIDVLAHNAGALFNERRRTDDGVDLSVELMVSAPFLMTARLLPALRACRTPARVLTMSSGGMYTEPLTVEGLEMPDSQYQGAKQYARAKRAQVTLNELWAERVPADDVVFHALHPGWVDTPGVSEALPGFSKILGPLQLLRSPREGADTLVWLSAAEAALHSTGQFWHDRATRSPHMSDASRRADTAERRTALWHWCEERTGQAAEASSASL